MFSFHFLYGFFGHAVTLQKLAEDLTIHRILNVKNDHYKVQYRDAEAQNVLTIGKKEFHHVDHQIKFKESWVIFEAKNIRVICLSRSIWNWRFQFFVLVTTIRLWIATTERGSCWVSNYIPAIISVRRGSSAATKLYAYSMSSVVWSYFNEPRLQKPHQWQQFLIITLQYNRQQCMHGRSQGKYQNKNEKNPIWNALISFNFSFLINNFLFIHHFQKFVFLKFMLYYILNSTNTNFFSSIQSRRRNPKFFSTKTSKFENKKKRNHMLETRIDKIFEKICSLSS